MTNTVSSDQLYQAILERLLDAVPTDVDKREGGVIFNALSPVALEIEQIYQELADVLKNTFADTADLEWLILRAKERGIHWIQATNAVVKATLTFDSSEVMEEPEVVGSVFALENSSLMYEVIERVSFTGTVGTYLLQCTEPGIKGNIAFGSLLIEEATDDALFDSLQIAEISSLEISARNDEDVESLRKRYLLSIDSEAFGGNIADYREKSLLLPMIGAIKVIPVWNGGGTVKLIFLNAVFDIPTDTEILQVKNAFDPDPEGEGYGLAPIGHTVTVVAADEAQMDVACEVTYETGYDWERLFPTIKAVCEDYFLSLRKEWENGIITVSPGVLANQAKRTVPHINTFSCYINGHASDFNLENNEAPTLNNLTEAE